MPQEMRVVGAASAVGNVFQVKVGGFRQSCRAASKKAAANIFLLNPGLANYDEKTIRPHISVRTIFKLKR
ncbi:MAG: hypothetical protein G01um101419_688 [Parcubacteria group bacterium Gr01-1014_19]|nr:MAG: hypothetical protein G01um101419_772 [Parcubacteria group bacterium Gr01-1014_19]TSC81992.1 MAG: hypothetical protein G01um101419_688 [Parcubacteria group bacterium Gr01-1014_19]